MIRTLLASILVAGMLAATTPSAHAAAFDPDLEWRTLETPHFNITFHQGEAALAEEVSHIAEEVWAKMTKELGTDPKRPTELVLIDPTDMANGYAMSLPVNTIVIYVTSPSEDSTLSKYEDWNDAILTHEYTHTLHLDTIEGLPKLLRMVLGRIVNINRASPGWMVEGLATLQETRHTPGGRGRSNVAHMIKRMAVVEDQFPPLGNLDGFQVDPPGGNLRYLFGQDFQQYIADEVGQDVWTDWIHTYGGWIPYWLPTKRVFGKRLVPLYRGWKVSLEERYGKQLEAVQAAGETPTSLISDGIDNCMGPTWSPDGSQLLFSCVDPVDGSAIMIHSEDEEEPEIQVRGAFAKDFSWRSDGKAFFYSAIHTVDRFNLYDDVYFHQIGKQSSSLLTRGKRARHPSLSPDGKDLLVVTNKLQQNQLARMTIDQQIQPLTELGRHEQLATPHFSPDGRYIAMSKWQDGERDIWIYSADGTPYRQIDLPGAHDQDPAWSADGRWLYFSSDQTGIFNIYAVQLENEMLYQVTNVIGGAFHPSPHPDATRIAFESFSHNGMDIVETTLGLDKWTKVETLAAPETHGGGLADTQSLDQDVQTPPTEAGEVEASLHPKGKRLPAGLEHPMPPPVIPGLQGYGGPMHGWEALPAFGNPFLDAPETGPDIEHGEVTTDKELDKEEDFPFTYPVRRYQPARTMFPPRYIRPSATLAYGDTFMGYVGTSSWDTLMRWFYSGFLSYRSDNGYLGWGASLAYNKMLPVISGGAYSSTVRYGTMFREVAPQREGGSWVRSIEQLDDRYFDKRTKAYLGVSFPMNKYQASYIQWQGTHRTPLVPLDAYAAQGINIYRAGLPTRGLQSAIGGGWGYSKGSSYGRAISVEKGTSYGISGKLTSRYLGSYQLDDLDQRIPFSQFQFGGEYRKYLRVPWFDDHVFAAKISGGGAVGDRTRYGSYRLGGNFGQGGLYTLPEEYRSLRGFNPGTVYGDWYYLSRFEYRMPVWWIDRGVGTIPFYARYISATAFLDAGYAFNNLPSGADAQDTILPNTLVGAGAELRGTAIIGYGVSATARMGYAFAVRGPGIPIGSLDGLYIRFDTGF